MDRLVDQDAGGALGGDEDVLDLQVVAARAAEPRGSPSVVDRRLVGSEEERTDLRRAGGEGAGRVALEDQPAAEAPARVLAATPEGPAPAQAVAGATLGVGRRYRLAARGEHPGEGRPGRSVENRPGAVIVEARQQETGRRRRHGDPSRGAVAFGQGAEHLGEDPRVDLAAAERLGDGHPEEAVFAHRVGDRLGHPPPGLDALRSLPEPGYPALRPLDQGHRLASSLRRETGVVPSMSVMP